MSTVRRLVLPVLARHLLREFLGVFLLTLSAFVAIYVVAEFFDRVDNFLRQGTSAGAVVRYFVFKLPVIVSQATPLAVLVGALVGLGLLARQNEFVALRACGVSIWQIALPLLGLAAAVSAGMFAWNETVVPYGAQRYHAIDTHELKKRGAATLFTGRDVWYHGHAGFYNIDRVSLRRRTLYGLTVYQLDDDFRPARQVEVDVATWDGARWHFNGARTRKFEPDGEHLSAGTPPRFVLPETLEDFGTVAIEPEAMSHAMLRRQIKDLRRKGVDASESLVDLHLKIALPAASLLMMLLAIPLSVTGTRRSSFATAVAIGCALAFGYYVVLGFAHALGQGGPLPPALAAWSANLLVGLVGGYLVLGSD